MGVGPWGISFLATSCLSLCFLISHEEHRSPHVPASIEFCPSMQGQATIGATLWNSELKWGLSLWSGFGQVFFSLIVFLRRPSVNSKGKVRMLSFPSRMLLLRGSNEFLVEVGTNWTAPLEGKGEKASLSGAVVWGSPCLGLRVPRLSHLYC